MNTPTKQWLWKLSLNLERDEIGVVGVDPWAPEVDKVHGFVIRAENEGDARSLPHRLFFATPKLYMLADECEYLAIFRGQFGNANLWRNVWQDQEMTCCTCIGGAAGYSEEVILRDFRAG